MPSHTDMYVKEKQNSGRKENSLLVRVWLSNARPSETLLLPLLRLADFALEALGAYWDVVANWMCSARAMVSFFFATQEQCVYREQFTD